MKLELKNKQSSLIIESLDSTKYTCDTCPDGFEKPAIGVIYWDYKYFITADMTEPTIENIEIKFCVNCKEIIRKVFDSLG